MGKQKLVSAKAMATEDSEGFLTTRGLRIAQRYASRWLRDRVRDLELERDFPEMLGLFYDIRADAALAREHAIPLEPPTPESLKKSLLVIPLQ